MSGGVNEYVMGRLATSSSDNSGVPGDFYVVSEARDNSKYYKITYLSIEACSLDGCLGDALHETTNWHGDYHNFVYVPTYRYFSRGGPRAVGNPAGIFGYSYASGGGHEQYSFRTILIAR